MKYNKEIIIFGINGLVGLCIAYAVYQVLMIGLSLEINTSYFISYLISVIYSFISNKIFTFKNKQSVSFFMILKFVLLTLFAMWTSSLLNLFVYKELAFIEAGVFIAFCSGIALAAIINFSGMKILIFKN